MSFATQGDMNSEKPQNVSQTVPAWTDSQTEEGVRTWNEFTQNTTFHGVKYIFERNQHKIRRQVHRMGYISSTNQPRQIT